MNALVATLYLVCALRLASLSASAEAAPRALPVIEAHSQTEFSVFKGDSLSLMVKAAGDGLEYKWVQAKNTTCRAATCDFDTSTWSIGTHNIALVVFNTSGSLYVKFRVKILVAPSGYRAGKVSPPIEAAGEGVETVSKADLAVSTLTGRGFSYHEKKLQVVGPAPRALDWGERLRTQDESTMQILRDRQEQHVLGASTSVGLARSPSGRRVLIFNKGVLRSRQLNGKDPQWSVIHANWLQVDADAQGDIVLRQVPGETDQVELYVVRGRARVFRRRADDRKGEESQVYGVGGEAFFVPQGGAVVLTRDFEAPLRVEHPDPEVIGGLIALTTPSYLPGKDLTELGRATMVSQDTDAATFSDALARAQKALTQRDYPLALEALAPFSKQVKSSYRANLALGSAYKGMLLDGAARSALQSAIRLKSAEAEPYFLLGEMELAAGHWRKAQDYLEQADERGYADDQTVSYYLGVASYALDEAVGAKHQLTKAQWLGQKSDVAHAAQELHRLVAYAGWIDVRSGLGVLYNSNVLQRGTGQTLPDGMQTTRSAGYEGHAGLSLWAVRSPIGYVGFGFDGRKIGWQAPSLVRLSTLKQELDVDFGVNSRTRGSEPPDFQLALRGYAATLIYGSTRAMDSVGMRAQIALPTLAGMTLHLRNQTNLDPLPIYDDILDPTRGEIVPASERSNHQSHYGLSLTPWSNDAWTLVLGYETGTTTMRNALHFDENYTDQAMNMRAKFEPSLRYGLNLELTYSRRSFPLASDQRRDNTVAGILAWRWHYTTSLYHDIKLEQQSQKSTRQLGSYQRTSVGYYLNFDM